VRSSTSFSSKNSYPDQNGYKINVLLPVNIFNFSGSNVTVEGNLQMQLGNGDDVSRKLASGIGPEAAAAAAAAAAPFKLNIALTDDPTAAVSKINDAVRQDSAPPSGYLVPVLAVFASVSLLAMAGMAIRTIRKRRAHGKDGHC